MSGGGIIAALRGLRLIAKGEQIVTPLPIGKPRGYWGRYPIRRQGTLAEVDRLHPPHLLRDCRACGECRASTCANARCPVMLGVPE